MKHSSAQNAGDALTFSVTFRLDQRQIDFINDTFRHILDGGAGQVEFVELQPRPTVLPGQVIQVSLGSSLLEGIEKPKDRQIARIEAEQLAAWLKKCGPEKLRARNWRHVANSLSAQGLAEHDGRRPAARGPAD
jgi:hypothetical protein